MENNSAEYNNMYNEFLAGRLTEAEWNQYCQVLLYEKIEVHKDVFIRLKEGQKYE